MVTLSIDPLSGAGGNIYVWIFGTHSFSAPVIATSTVVAGPTVSGTYTTFTFATPWQQVKGATYYIYPVDPNPSNPSYTWGVSEIGSKFSY